MNKKEIGEKGGEPKYVIVGGAFCPVLPRGVSLTPFFMRELARRANDNFV